MSRKKNNREKICIIAEHLDPMDHFIYRLKERIGIPVHRALEDIAIGVLQGRVYWHRGFRGYKVVGNEAKYLLDKSFERAVTTYKKINISNGHKIQYKKVVGDDYELLLKGLGIL